ncbi:MAG: hypothetical protein H7X77_00555 [Anaerolineae bacterium]|nr:hypothetical protein [Anaerolineae bacterium]
MAQSEYDDPVIIDDPVYGQALGNYPADRGRLLLIGGSLYFVSSAVLNLAFAQVDAALAAIIVISGMAILALLIGWYILHLWNREVVLYARGFSYREGSRLIFITYLEVTSIRQRAERVAYFGGLVRRTIYQIILQTSHDETIILDNLYRRIDELGIRLEQQINQAQRPVIEAKLQAGGSVPFGDGLTLTPDGLQVGDQRLTWDDYQTFAVSEGKLTLTGSTLTLALPLAQIDHLTLLLELLRARKR